MSISLVNHIILLYVYHKPCRKICNRIGVLSIDNNSINLSATVVYDKANINFNLINKAREKHELLMKLDFHW